MSGIKDKSTDASPVADVEMENTPSSSMNMNDKKVESALAYKRKIEDTVGDDGDDDNDNAVSSEEKPRKVPAKEENDDNNVELKHSPVREGGKDDDIEILYEDIRLPRTPLEIQREQTKLDQVMRQWERDCRNSRKFPWEK